MDNLCHTLVGATLGEAGLNRKTAYGTATLMIASNLPDIDVLVFATSTPSVAFRRGWTHGVLADVVLPVALTAVMVAIARRRGRTDVRAGSILLLSYVGVLLHVAMDLLNTYGVRLLMPFSQRWFYGDVLFIIDPWLWVTLGAGLWLARRGRSVKPARISLLVATAYVAAMLVSARLARAEMIDRWQQVSGRPPQGVMVGPMPITPLRRQVIIDEGDRYESGTFTWGPRSIRFDQRIVPKNDRDPSVAEARDAPNIRAFLLWSRFPFWTFEPAEGGMRVTVGDMRFNGGLGVAVRNFTQSTVVADRSAGP
ncbi:MAG TPA: metal-dependent hydrolase [Vicinamibacterales bacterium]|nr:metal-dependent hydrolase [Vicinamibacterales bacterium]